MVTARTVDRPSPSGEGTDLESPGRAESRPPGRGPTDRDQALASEFGRGLAYHRWARYRAAVELAGQLLLFVLEPADVIQDPEEVPE